MWILFVVVIASLIAAVFAVYYAYFVSPLLIFGVLAAGAAGSCASVMSKMPTLENRLSRKPDSYAGGVLARIATGLIGTVIGCALLAWVPLSIGDKSFGTLVSACTTGPSTTANPCSTLTMLILIGIATLLGFSERTLPFFEQRMFGKAGLPPTRAKRFEYAGDNLNLNRMVSWFQAHRHAIVTCLDGELPEAGLTLSFVRRAKTR